MNNLTDKQKEKLAFELRDFLIKNFLWIDVSIYFNGKCLRTYDKKHNIYGDNDSSKIFIEENVEPRNYFDYCGDILSMSFEGPLYDLINYGSCKETISEFEAIFDKYGLYYELGNDWNLTAYYK